MKAIIFGAIMALSVLGVFTPAMAAETTPPPEMTVAQFHDAMRMLWEEHIVYTRNFIISALAGLGDTNPIAERLLHNQDEIGNAIKPFYGNAAGDKLANYLREHIAIAGDITMAAKKGDNDAVNSGEKKWHDNADLIAGFLASANPNWTKVALTDLLYKHLEITTNEVVSRIKMDWAGDIAAYDMGHAHILKMADALSSGIIKQFPEKFK